MIELPWQIVAAFVAYLIVDRVLRHVRVSSCEERIELATREARRDATSVYREAYRKGMEHGREDSHDGETNEKV